jgi:hypothetical protein
MTVKIARFASYTGNELDGIGSNSVTTVAATKFVTKTNEFVALATAGSEISGASITQKAFDSDNQTVAKARLAYIPNHVDITYDCTISNGTITVVDEGKYYDLMDSVTVDGATESTTTGQLRMVKFNSATNSTFRIVNL